MTEKELIAKLQKLRQIKPNRNWVILTKHQILGEKINPLEVLVNWFGVFFAKPVYLGLIVILVGLFGTFNFAQKSLPGDYLYQLKKITEKAQAVFVSEEEKPQVSLELANKRLEELTEIAQTNQVKKLAPAIKEVQVSLSEAAKNLARIEATSSDPAVVKKFVDQAKSLEKKAKKVSSLGVVIEGEELNELAEASNKLELELLVSVLKNMITDLENRTLTEKQQEVLVQMKELVEEGKYSQALELYLINQ